MQKNRKNLRDRHKFVISFLDNQNDWIHDVQKKINELLHENDVYRLKVGGACLRNHLFDKLIFSVYKNKVFLFYFFIPIFHPYEKSRTFYFIEKIVEDILKTEQNAVGR